MFEKSHGDGSKQKRSPTTFPRWMIVVSMIVAGCVIRRLRAHRGRGKSGYLGSSDGGNGESNCGAAIILGKRAVVDLPTVLVAVVSLHLLLRFKKIPEPLIILGAGVVAMTVKYGWL